MADINLFDDQGRRKYITKEERKSFLEASRDFDGKTTTFCYILAFTGCRIFEGLNLKGKHIDIESQAITFETLKKRRKGIFRQVPIPKDLLDLLKAVHNPIKYSGSFLWANKRNNQLSKMGAYKQVKKVFLKAGINEPMNQPKALRHGFAINALQAGVPLNQVQKWLGHSSITTTAIYANALGEEERALAAKMWQ